MQCWNINTCPNWGELSSRDSASKSSLSAWTVCPAKFLGRKMAHRSWPHPYRSEAKALSCRVKASKFKKCINISGILAVATVQDCTTSLGVYAFENSQDSAKFDVLSLQYLKTCPPRSYFLLQCACHLLGICDLQKVFQQKSRNKSIICRVSSSTEFQGSPPILMWILWMRSSSWRGLNVWEQQWGLMKHLEWFSAGMGS